MNIRSLSKLLLVAASIFALTACGGGGGGGGAGFFPLPAGASPQGQPGSYLLSGKLAGLAVGQSLVAVRTNADGAVGEQLTLITDCDFQFTQRTSGDYNVSITAQPAGQTCSVGNGAGVASADVTNILITCVSQSYAISGVLKGLTSGTVVLRNNGVDDLALSADGPFSFAAPVVYGGGYQVAVQVQPAGQLCAITDDQGVADVGLKGVQVICQALGVPSPATPPANLRVSYAPKSFQFAWDPVAGASYYRMMEDPDGPGPLPAVAIGDNLDAGGYVHTVALYQRLNATYTVQACNASGCSAASAPLAPDVNKAIGYFKASNTEALEHFGRSVALSADGRTLAVGAIGEDSAGAVYVFVHTDGTWVRQAHLKASNPGAGDEFGGRVSLSSDGNVLAVGAENEGSSATGVNGDIGAQADNAAPKAGAVYIFTRLGSSWAQQAYVKASNADKGDMFGHALALSGDGKTLAVGAYGQASQATGIDGDKKNRDAPESGAVYVFIRAGTTWTEHAYIKASNTEAGDNFGLSIALSTDGSVLGVGAPREDGGATGVGVAGDRDDNSANISGAVYVFNRAGAAWVQQAYIKASNTGAGDGFGATVGLAGNGNTLAVSAPFESSNARGIEGDQADNSAPGAGALYVFARAGTTWLQQAYIKASNAKASGGLGNLGAISISADGDTLAIGAAGEASNATGLQGDQANGSAKEAGAVYVFIRMGTVWSQQAYVKASNTESGDDFGRSVALSADGRTLSVGASSEASKATGIGGDQKDNSAASAGAVYIY